MKLLSILSILLLFGSVFAVDAINKKVIEPNSSSVNEKTAPGAKQIAEQITKDLKSKVIEKAALADMKVIRKALNIYKLQNGKFPTTKEGITALVKKPKNQKNWSGPFLKKLPLDPWGKLYHYSYSEKTKICYLSSSGPDGKHKNGDDIIDEHNR